MITFVGEAPGGRPNAPVPSDHRPLHPHPPNCAGDRLWRLTGWTLDEYIRAERVNLITARCSPTPWSATEAREQARELIDGARGRTLVLLGSRVRKAFGAEYPDFCLDQRDGCQAVCVPHPSGRNLAWNDPETKLKALKLFNLLREAT